jgi:hypothetical protein
MDKGRETRDVVGGLRDGIRNIISTSRGVVDGLPVSNVEILVENLRLEGTLKLGAGLPADRGPILSVGEKVVDRGLCPGCPPFTSAKGTGWRDCLRSAIADALNRILVSVVLASRV